MEPDGSLLCSQELVTAPYPKKREFILFLKDPFNIITPVHVYAFLVDSFLLVFPQNPYMQFSSLPCVLPLSSSLPSSGVPLMKLLIMQFSNAQ
jgi:hypothetical protein